jgi:thymidylate synthase ThyX
MTTEARFVTEPIVEAIGQMELMPQGIRGMVDWVRSRAPACVPDGITSADTNEAVARSLFPHDGLESGRVVSDNELLIELAGRSCYNSFGLKAGRKDNASYIKHTQEMDPPHASVTYHAKMSFFIAGVSRRVSHELIRNYVGADRTEEGAPSQQSTRYVENAGFYITPPRYLLPGNEEMRLHFERDCTNNFERYRDQIQLDLAVYLKRTGSPAKGMDYKRILEAASGLLIHSVETSFIWTTNPGALAKLFKERDNEAADLEFQRFARKWKRLCMTHWPNAFPQPWMREGL